MTIRPLSSPADDAAWLRMRRALWPEQDDAAHHADMAAWRGHPKAVVLVAALPDGGLAGFAEVGERSVADGCDTSPVAYLEGWYVAADARRRGVGAALVRAAEAWARARGYRELASDALLTNHVSQRAHAALGFREIDRVVVYAKTL